MPESHDGTRSEQLSAWRQAVEKSLNGGPFSTLQSRTRDGIVMDPLYPPASESKPVPGRGPKPWTIVQTLDDPDPERANVQALRDLDGGATGLALRFAGGPLAPEYGLPPTEEALSFALEGVDFASVQLRIDPHPLGSEIANWVRELVGRRAVAPELAAISFGLDPVAGHLRAEDSTDSEALVAAAVSLDRSGFRGGLCELDGRPFHEAGSTEAQELAAILASAAWWLRSLDGAGMPAETSTQRLGASLAVDCDQFLSIAKVRALRLLWARLQELCGVAATPLRVHAETSRRMLTARAPQTNLVRATIAAFAAGVGGADSISVRPYSMALGPAESSARALARNTHHLLVHEAKLHYVTDPSAGSGAVEAMTEALAEVAWAKFRNIEADGGIVESLRVGALPARIAAAREALGREVAEGTVPLVGATVYRDASELMSDASATAGHFGPLTPVRLEEMAAVS